MLRHPIREEDPRMAIIVPVLNEIDGIEPLLSHLEIWRQRGAEIIVVDPWFDDLIRIHLVSGLLRPCLFLLYLCKVLLSAFSVFSIFSPDFHKDLFFQYLLFGICRLVLRS